MGKSKKPGKLIFVGYDIGKEKWKTIYLDGEKTKYKISNYGRVKNKNTKKILATILDRYGYEQVCLIHKGKRHSLTVHTLVAKYFIPNKELLLFYQTRIIYHKLTIKMERNIITLSLILNGQQVKKM